MITIRRIVDGQIQPPQVRHESLRDFFRHIHRFPGAGSVVSYSSFGPHKDADPPGDCFLTIFQNDKVIARAIINHTERRQAAEGPTKGTIPENLVGVIHGAS